MSRLNFAPKMDEIRITDIKGGLGEFVPKPDKPASFAALKATLKKAGYTLSTADITVSGTLVREGDKWNVEASQSKQRFDLEGDEIEKTLQGIDPGTAIVVIGDWQTVGKEPASREVIKLASAKKIAGIVSNAPSIAREIEHDSAALKGIQVSLAGNGFESGLYFSSIRTTSPGLTVYKGGAVIPRYFYTRQHLGGLKIDRHALRLGLSYTPTPTLQLEAEIPYQHSSFENGNRFGSGDGLGNVTLWGKYRFFRTLETWGDKQAAIRVGIELPSGKKDAPRDSAFASSDFVLQQLSPINGGVAFHSDVGSSRVDLQACKLEYSIVSPK